METSTNVITAASPSFDPTQTFTIEQISKRRGVSVTFLRNQIRDGSLRAMVLAPNSGRKKMRILAADELAWLTAHPSTTLKG